MWGHFPVIWFIFGSFVDRKWPCIISKWPFSPSKWPRLASKWSFSPSKWPFYLQNDLLTFLNCQKWPFLPLNFAKLPKNDLLTLLNCQKWPFLPWNFAKIAISRTGKGHFWLFKSVKRSFLGNFGKIQG